MIVTDGLWRDGRRFHYLGKWRMRILGGVSFGDGIFFQVSAPRLVQHDEHVFFFMLPSEDPRPSPNSSG